MDIRDGATPPPDDAPAAPLNLTLTSTASGTVTAACSAVPGATGYNFYRRLNGEPGWTKMGTATAGPGMDLPGQPIGVEMEWAVTAYNDAGEGAKSVPESITL